jgi:uncharacterized protein (DUF1800 family)
MVVSTPVQGLTDVELMAHLFRRAGFGATRDEIEAAAAKGYEATVDELVHPERQPEIELDLIYRFWPDAWEGRRIEVNQGYWLYRMVNTQRPLEEKIALFWHCLFATAFNKSNHSGILLKQIDMFRQYGLGDFATLLVELSKDPAMIHWLDNQENTIKVHNENYGRELLELFSMGIGNYTEDDVKECARAFTGWGLKNLVRAGPMGRNDWEFQFYPEMHDYGEKTFLGETGNFDGPDVINIIVKQPATAQFIAKRLYLFFVSDEPNQEAIDELARVFTETGGNIRAVVTALLLSDVFRSRAAYYAKVKSPAEHVAGLVRLVGDHRFPNFGIHEVSAEFGYMGQDLMNPPSVEGWHTGKEWIDTGILVERINFAAGLMADPNKPGVRALIDRVRAQGDELSPKQLVDTCLDLIGPLPVREATEASLVDHANKKGSLNVKSDDPAVVDQRITEMLQLIVATREYQFG